MSEEVTRFHYHRSDAVAVLIYDEVNGACSLIKQFRYAVYAKTGDGWLTECVAGMMEENETPLEVAHRGVFEETGLRLRRVELLAQYFSAPEDVRTEFTFMWVPLRIQTSRSASAASKTRAKKFTRSGFLFEKL
jgi:ADP-ribose pyrophosphatase